MVIQRGGQKEYIFLSLSPFVILNLFQDLKGILKHRGQSDVQNDSERQNGLEIITILRMTTLFLCMLRDNCVIWCFFVIIQKQRRIF